MASDPAQDREAPPVDDFASQVLDVIDSIQVGRVLAVYGGAVAWWRVIHSDGTPAPGHESRALEHYLAEGTPLRSGRPPVRVDMRRARWPGATAPLAGPAPPQPPAGRDTLRFGG
jgi:alkylated DNA nucleotide flippase Atl1